MEYWTLPAHFLCGRHRQRGTCGVSRGHDQSVRTYLPFGKVHGDETTRDASPVTGESLTRGLTTCRGQGSEQLSHLTEKAEGRGPWSHVSHRHVLRRYSLPHPVLLKCSPWSRRRPNSPQTAVARRTLAVAAGAVGPVGSQSLRCWVAAWTAGGGGIGRVPFLPTAPCPQVLPRRLATREGGREMAAPRRGSGVWDARGPTRGGHRLCECSEWQRHVCRDGRWI